MIIVFLFSLNIFFFFFMDRGEILHTSRFFYSFFKETKKWKAEGTAWKEGNTWALRTP